VGVPGNSLGRHFCYLIDRDFKLIAERTKEYKCWICQLLHETQQAVYEQEGQEQKCLA
jgi:hypothetical protein